MLSVSPNSVARSSLEEMLESLRQRDESEAPKDVPPALPARPRASSRARLPSPKRVLPTSSEVSESGSGESSLNCCAKEGERKEQRGNSFGAKRIKETEPGESPYVLAASANKGQDQRAEEKDNAELSTLPPGSLVRFRESEWDDNVGYFIKKKLRVWCRMHDGHWESGQIKSTAGEKALVLLSDGSVVTVPTQELLPANPDILEGVDDLLQLSYLNEPSVLHNLQCRYSKDKIYSKAGPVLLAVNPFKDVEPCGNDYITAFRQKLLDNPHVYAVAETAYNEMMTAKKFLVMICSGESGSGKSETAKIALQYLAAIGGGGGGIESEILQTSCILEAFGNAKTAKNDNSSRFSRVVQLAQGERSFHIFYQLCSGAPSDLRGRLRLKKASDYNYLNQSVCLEIQNIDDAQKFHMLMGALNTVNICKEDQEHAFETLAAVLWLGNISFLVTDKQNHIEVVADEAVINAASLIGCSEQDLILALSTRKIQAGKDEVTRRLTLQQAIDSRDALAKFIYASLFDWLVEKINVSLSMGKHNTWRSISLLDICGFESFKKNSFEQFCRNYANERLQQHVNRHLFKLKQEEYELEGIERTKVDFEDNQSCLDLFEKKPTGLISLLDEVSNLPKATGLTFATKLKQQLNAHHCFKVDRGGFSIRHYGGEVLYDTGEFLEKNRDSLHSETIQLLSSCTGELPQYFASTLLKQSQSPQSASGQLAMLSCQRESVATKFKVQLFKLMQHLESTAPHFICCIKPNSKQISGVFEKDLVLQQLRCCGVIEGVRISRSGYPIRMTHQEFTRKYRCLLPENMACQDPLSMSMAILQQFDVLPEMYQVGYTKIYFRAGLIGALEDVRKQILQGTPGVQKCFRGDRVRRDFHVLKGVVVTLQSYVRGEIARKEYSVLLRLKKKQVACDKLDKQLMAAVQIQSAIRGWFARRHLSHLRNSKQSNASKLKPGRRSSEVKVLPPETLSSVVDELQKRVLMAEATLEQKKKENEALREQVQQFEARWPEYEAKMKSMEEMWQKQMASLQMSLASAQKSTHNTIGQPGRLDGAQSPQFYDSEDMSMSLSMGTQTPGGSTPLRFVNNGIEELPCRDTNGGLNPVGPLMKEFERRRQNFDEEAQAIVEVKSGHFPSVNPVEELRRLKNRFESWKKDYKVRLKEAKAKAQKLVQNDSEKHRRKWWSKKK
ncbi:Myosin-2 [Sesamum alatum]|uniref:Myosin-2 n=1 Tax=Sesamum alatum TaxID=300844 RepID=A0AAE1XZ46_9LAMI|nr:Myosin-2 [Sesamum alatum]